MVAIPQGIAFSAIAGLPPEYGLYAAMVPAIVAALFGSSWHMVSGPTTPVSIVLFSVLSVHALPGSPLYIRLALAVTVMVGVMQLALGAMRLGALVDFVSHSVLVGFTAGAAVLITASQIGHFIGVNVPGHPHAYQTLFDVLRHIPAMEIPALGVGVLTLAMGIASERYLPRLPAMMTALVVGSLVAAMLELGMAGDTGLGYAPSVLASLPPFSVPIIGYDEVRTLAPAAFALCILTLTQSMSIARSLAIQSGQRLDPNRDVVAQGLSNIAGGFFSGYVSSGSFNRSALNMKAGARTPLAAVLGSALLMAVAPAIAPLVAFVPTASLAAVMLIVSWGLVDIRRIVKILRASRSEAAIMGLTFLTAVVLDLEFAILLGVLGSLFVYILDASRPRIFSKVPDPASPKRSFVTEPSLAECPQLKIVRIDGSLFFGAVHHVQKMLMVFEQRFPRQNHLLLVATGINRMDVSGAELLAEEAKRRRERGGRLYLYDINDRVRELLRRGRYLQEIGEDNVFSSKQDALAGIVTRVNHEVCRECNARIFIECQSLPHQVTAG